MRPRTICMLAASAALVVATAPANANAEAFPWHGTVSVNINHTFENPPHSLTDVESLTFKTDAAASHVTHRWGFDGYDQQWALVTTGKVEASLVDTVMTDCGPNVVTQNATLAPLPMPHNEDL